MVPWFYCSVIPLFFGSTVLWFHGGKIRTKLGLAEATGGDEARLGMGSRGARGCVEAVEVWQGEGEQCGVGRATRNIIIIAIGTHVDVTFADGGDEGVQGQTEEEGKQRTALFQPVGHPNPCVVGAGENGEGNHIFEEGNEVDDPRRRADLPQQVVPSLIYLDNYNKFNWL
jgi:hypothetical protein